MNLNLNLVFLKSMNLNFNLKTENKMNGSNPGCNLSQAVDDVKSCLFRVQCKRTFNHGFGCDSQTRCCLKLFSLHCLKNLLPSLQEVATEKTGKIRIYCCRQINEGRSNPLDPLTVFILKKIGYIIT